MTASVPGTPAPVARMIHALLQRAPAARPRSAEEALAALGPSAGPEVLPWLGPRDAVEATLERARAGRPTWRLLGVGGWKPARLEVRQFMAGRVVGAINWFG